MSPHPSPRRSSRSAFTLIELLIVLAIISILAIVVVLTLQPAQLLAQGRDANRVSDMDTLTHALSLYQTDQGGSPGYTMGNASSVYVSLPDSSSTCGSWGLPSLPTGYTYQCAPSSTYRNSNGSGWIPVNFSSSTSGSPLSDLPIDPTNTSSTGLYYTYYTNGSQFEVTSLFESSKYKAQYAATPTDPDYPEVDAKGSSLAISPLYNPSGLVGYWPLNEGSGTIAYDQSGNGNNGTWNGSTTNGSYYTGGKVGPYAGTFNGSNDYVEVGSFNNSPANYLSFAASAWFKTTSVSDQKIISQINATSSGSSSELLQTYGGDIRVCLGVCSAGGTLVNDGNWHFAVIVGDGTSIRAYLDGNPIPQFTISPYAASASGVYDIGAGRIPGIQYVFLGAINDVRIYNRALSPAEIAALYNAEK